jgi:hypothetical protein
MAQAMAFQNATWLVETASAARGWLSHVRPFAHRRADREIAAKATTEKTRVVCFNCDIDLAQDLKRTMFNFAAHRRPTLPTDRRAGWRGSYAGELRKLQNTCHGHTETRKETQHLKPDSRRITGLLSGIVLLLS